MTFEPWPVFDDGDQQAVAAVLASGRVNYWTGGEGVAFEREYADAVGVPHAIAASNGTTALEMALHGCGLQPGQEVIVPSRTFIATASAVVARGGVPVCCDVDRDSGCLTPETIADVLTPNTAGVIPVHLGGWPCDMPAIMTLARDRGLFVVEDCAQAHGATIDDCPVGSFGDAGCFSFCQDKILTTGGEGGLLVTSRDDVYDRAWSLKDHGKRPASKFAPPTADPTCVFRWLHDSFGTNMRMSEMQAAIGRRMLRKLPLWSERRRRHAARLAGACRRWPSLRVPETPSRLKHAAYKFYAYLDRSRLAAGWTRSRIVAAIREQGVPVFGGSCSEIYLENAFPPEWRPEGRHPVARELGETSLMFLVHPTLSTASIDRTCEAIHQVMGQSLAAPARDPRPVENRRAA